MRLARFESQVALVTGASGGIGGAISEALVAEGAEVHALSRKRKQSDRLTWHEVDLSDDRATEAAANQIASTIDELDILVHAAGDFAMGTVAHSPIKDLDRMWRINMRAPWVLTKALSRALSARHGSVVFLNSSIWNNARGGTGAYSASKYALKAFADALRDELNPVGVRVLSVFPGRTASAMQQGIFAEENRAYNPDLLLQPDDISQIVLQSLSSANTAEVTDIHVRPAKKF